MTTRRRLTDDGGVSLTPLARSRARGAARLPHRTRGAVYRPHLGPCPRAGAARARSALRHPERGKSRDEPSATPQSRRVAGRCAGSLLARRAGPASWPIHRDETPPGRRALARAEVVAHAAHGTRLSRHHGHGRGAGDCVARGLSPHGAGRDERMRWLAILLIGSAVALGAEPKSFPLTLTQERELAEYQAAVQRIQQRAQAELGAVNDLAKAAVARWKTDLQVPPGYELNEGAKAFERPAPSPSTTLPPGGQPQ